MSNRLVNKFMEIYAIIGVDRQIGYKWVGLSRVNSMRGL